MGKTKVTKWAEGVLKSLFPSMYIYEYARSLHHPRLLLHMIYTPSSQCSCGAFVDLRKSFVLDVRLITDAANSSLWKGEVRISAVPRRRAFLILDFPTCAGSISGAEVLVNTLCHGGFSTPACVGRS
jgi:hypothetical protein